MYDMAQLDKDEVEKALVGAISLFVYILSSRVPTISWFQDPTTSINSSNTSTYARHFVGIIFDLLSEVGVDVPGRQFQQYPKQIGHNCIC
jgi:hypothetical protein